MTALRDRLEGVLLGTALGDALGLAAEGMTARAIARRFGRVERFHLLGSTGFVSDDTEQTALVAAALASHANDPQRLLQTFRRSLLGWFARLPFGIGLATLRACMRIAFGCVRSGVPSAGNGAAMRAAPIGVFFFDDPERRRTHGAALARVTHTDPRAVEGALFVAEMAAGCVRAEGGPDRRIALASLEVIKDPSLRLALTRAIALADDRSASAEAAAALGTTGFVMHSVPLATFAFLRHGTDPLNALSEVISVGGDTDTTAAMVGAWVGALHGSRALPASLLDRIHDGPFGPSHLRALANSLAAAREGQAQHAVRYSRLAALLRNLALYPVVLAHGFRRLLP